MMKVSIILGDTNDYHAQYMLDSCLSAGIQAYMFDSATFPTRSSISWDPACSSGILHIPGNSIDFADIGSVFWSTLNMCHCPVKEQQEQHQIALSDSSSLLRTFLEETSFNWVNSWQVFQFHKVKPRQLSLASKCGLKIPSTYIGNNTSDMIEFVESRGQCIYKPVYGGALTAPLTPDLMENEHLNQVLKISPVTIQQYIPGTNVRTFVIGEQVFSAEIQSEYIDFRIEESALHKAIKTPGNIVETARQITAAFGMQWTAIDWRRDLQGEYYFLEANPSPMFTHFERCTGYPITENLMRLLSCN